MRFQLTLSQKTFLLVTIPLTFQLTFATMLLVVLNQVEQERAHLVQVRELTSQINNGLQALLYGGMTNLLYQFTNGSTFETRFRKTALVMRTAAQGLNELASSPIQLLPGQPSRKPLVELALRYRGCAETMQLAEMAVAQQDHKKVQLLWSDLSQQIDELFANANATLIEQQAFAENYSKTLAQNQKRLSIILLVGIVMNIVLVILLLTIFNRGTNLRLSVLMDNAVKLASEDTLNPPLSGSDELAQLDLAFHNMASTLAEAARKERAIIQNAVDVIASIQPDNRITAINKAAERIWGYSPEELIGMRLSQFVVKNDRQKTINYLHQAMAERSYTSFENRMVSKGGTLVDMLWSTYWSEQERSLFCVAHDITARKELERVKQDLVTMVSHDLRTPLTSIRGFLSVLATGIYNKLSSNGLESLAIAEASVNRLIALVNDLLDLEKMESGRLELYCSHLNLKDLVEQSINYLKPYCETQGVTIEAPLKDKNPIDIYADEARLMQVLMNLLANAVKFSSRGSKVRVEAEDINDYVEVRVLDTGRGVPVEMREDIFDRFKQVELSDERAKGGFGLGLAICKAIIERHHGLIGVKSGTSLKDVEGLVYSNTLDANAAVGSCFWFRIPKQGEAKSSLADSSQTSSSSV